MPLSLRWPSFGRTLLLALALIATLIGLVRFAPAAQAAEPAYPRTLGLYLAHGTLPSAADMARYDTIVIDMEWQHRDPTKFAAIRAINPDVKILAYVNFIDRPLSLGSQSFWQNRWDQWGYTAPNTLGTFPEQWIAKKANGAIQSEWAGTWMTNLSDTAPIVNGQRYYEYAAHWVADNVWSSGKWDGLFLDVWGDRIWNSSAQSWDVDRDGDDDTGSALYGVGSPWERGITAAENIMRAEMPGAIIVANNTRAFKNQKIDGRLWESFADPGKDRTFEFDVPDYVAGVNNAGHRQPGVQLTLDKEFTSANSATDQQRARYFLTATLLSNGYWGGSIGDYTGFGWHEEFHGAGLGRGYLGQPIAAQPTWSQISATFSTSAGVGKYSNGLYRRDFDNGIAITNPTSAAQTLTLETTFKRLNGTTSVNTGANVSTITIQPKDGIILLRLGAPVVTVSLTPSPTSVQIAGTRQFTGSASDSGALTWSVNGVAGGNSTVGTVSSSGLYTAPASVPSGGTVTVSASHSSGASASSTVTITSPTVSLSPSSVSLQTGATQQFTGSASDGSSLTWKVDGITGGNSTLGTVSSAGLYTAPASVPSGGSVTVTASHTTGISSFSTVTITAPATIPAPMINVPLGNLIPNARFTSGLSTWSTWQGTQSVATAADGSNVALVSRSAGTAFAFGDNGANLGVRTAGTEYHLEAWVRAANTQTIGKVSRAWLRELGSQDVGSTPLTLSSAWQQITVDITATGNAALGARVDLSGAVAGDAIHIAMISVVPVSAEVSVSLTPTTTSVETGATRQFTGAASDEGALTWKVDGIAGGNATVGTISSSGLYTAPAGVPSGGMVTVSASHSSGVSSSATVTITAPVSVSLTPASTSIETSTMAGAITRQFTGSASDAGALTWKVDGIAGGNSTVGTVSSAGLYTSPYNVPSGGQVTVSAHHSSGASASATVSVNAPTVSLTPATGTVAVNNQLQLTGSASNGGTLTWSVDNIVGGSSEIGNITSSGLYTAPATVPPGGTVTITARSWPTGALSTATLTITGPPTVELTPTAGTVETSYYSTFTTFQFTAVASDESAITWKVNGITGGNASLGTISSTGLYSAPYTPATAAPLTITATSASGATDTASLQVNYPTVTFGPSQNVTVPLGGTFQFSASASNGQPPIWDVNGIVGGNSTYGFIDSDGTYTAPAVHPGGSFAVNAHVGPRFGYATITLYAPSGIPAPGVTVPTGNLTTNPVFATGSGSWVPWRSALTPMVADDGATLIEAARTEGSAFTLGQQFTPTIPAAGTKYHAETWVRAGNSASIGGKAYVWLRENGYQDKRNANPVLLSNTWQKIEADITTLGSNKIDVRVSFEQAVAGNEIQVAMISVVQVP